MRIIVFLIATLFVTGSIGQTHRGIYKKKSCFCDNHSNSTGWNIGTAAYLGRYNFQNDFITNSTLGYGFGVFGANKLNDNIAVRLGVYRGILQPIPVDGDALRFSSYSSYEFKHWNMPLTFMYKFRSEKRLSPYTAMGAEMNILRSIGGSSVLTNGEFKEIQGEKGLNQFNFFLGVGTYILFGDHIGIIAQGTMDMNPFINDLSNYNFAITGKFGLTYHF